jgi:hypothetical protein
MDAMIHTINTDKIGRFITLKTPLTIFSIILSMRRKSREAWPGSELRDGMDKKEPLHARRQRAASGARAHAARSE